MRMPIVVASLTVATAAAAQSPAPQPGAMVTVEGCVTREPAGRTSSAPAQYVLTDQQAPATPAATSTTGTSSGATAAGSPASARKMYVLRAESASVNLANHVNQRVRATGATTGPMTTAPLAGRSPEATPNPAPTGPPGSTGTLFDTANLPTLAVTALVALNGRCERKPTGRGARSSLGGMPAEARSQVAIVPIWTRRASRR